MKHVWPLKGSLVLLSPRQQEVVQFMVWGLKAQEIAKRMGISYNTVKSHRTRAYHQLGATSAAQCVAIALSEGLVKGDPPWETS